MDLSESWTIWRVLDSRGLGAHSSWTVGQPFAHLQTNEVEVVEVVRATPRGAVDERERWTIWSLPGTTGQRVIAVDGRVPDARERIEVVEAEPANPTGAVGLFDDETRALVWAAHRAARYLRAEGWPDSKGNADALDRAVEKLESTDHPRGGVDPLAAERLARATGLARALADLPDGGTNTKAVREVAAEIVALLAATSGGPHDRR